MRRSTRDFCAFWVFLLVAGSCLAADGDVVLPTPLEAFENYAPQAETLVVFSELLQGLPPDRQAAISQLVLGAQAGLPPPSPEKIAALLRELNWQKQKARILRLVIYQSGILRVVEAQSPNWTRLVHDFILFFLDHLPEDRLLERIATVVQVSQGDGDRLLALIERTPTLQKLGQIVARYPGVPDAVHAQLQQLENSISTSRPDDIVALIESDLGAEALARYQIRFDAEILAEATIGVVIGATLVEHAGDKPSRVVFKVLKPYVVRALSEELSILDQLVLYFEKNAPFYDLGQVSLSEMFEDVKGALEKEIQIVEEQNNLRAARAYYAENPKVRIPRVLPQSTAKVTIMDFIEGGKIVDGFPNDPAGRAMLARRLDEIMTAEAIFSPEEQALFHGDPHPGNVFFLSDSPADPYRIALLDWGLRGELSRPQRQHLIQLLFGIKLRDEKRVRYHAPVLLAAGLPEDPGEAERVQSTAAAVLETSEGKDPFVVLSELVTELTSLGYSLDFNIALFIKAQVTILGMLHDLDPDLDREKVMGNYLRGATFKEFPKRLLYTVYFPKWTAHDYPTMVSNEDLRDVGFQSMGRGFKKFGGWIWAGLTFPFRGSADPVYEKEPVLPE